MSSFIKYHGEEVKLISGTVAVALAVGDRVALAEGAIAASETGSYIVAAGDMITYNLPTEYKSYKISDAVAISGTAKKVAVYQILDISDVE
jgi:hypothetical protein